MCLLHKPDGHIAQSRCPSSLSAQIHLWFKRAHSCAHSPPRSSCTLFLHVLSYPLMPTVQISLTLTFFHGTGAKAAGPNASNLNDAICHMPNSSLQTCTQTRYNEGKLKAALPLPPRMSTLEWLNWLKDSSAWNLNVLISYSVLESKWSFWVMQNHSKLNKCAS